MIENNRSQSHQNKIMEQTQRAIELAMVTKKLVTEEQSYIKNLAMTVSKEQQVKKALQNIRISPHSTRRVRQGDC